MEKFPTDVLKDWFVAHRRSLPWREQPTPYRVWISEVMLQQTQVAVVIPYFHKWMATFPTIVSLASAPIEQVLKCWEGLGYYSRARNLHLGAQEVVNKFGGVLPNNADDLATIPGIGPYTLGAILSFAFQKKAAAVDGNVLRVLSRFLACQEEIDTPSTRKMLQTYAEALLPDETPWLVSEGLIELGALICSKKADCGECPIQKQCLGYRHGLQHVLPKKKSRPTTTFLVRHVAVIMHGDCYAVQQGEKGKLMADLYEFPYLEKETLSPNELRLHGEKVWGLPLSYQATLPEQQHTFTRYRARLIPHLLTTEVCTAAFLWKNKAELEKLPFSSGHKRILNQLQNIRIDS